jgi:TonB family protein
MLQSKTFLSRASRRLFSSPQDASAEPAQRRLMVVALSLLVVALVAVLYHDRDFWFPDADQAENELQQPAPGSNTLAVAPQKQTTVTRSKSDTVKPRFKTSAQPESAPPMMAVASRTVLPPLEVEVVAGDTRRTIRPPSNEVKVELDSSPAQENQGTFSQPEIAGQSTTNAAERVQMSTDTSQLVSRSVEPGYPLLARQMKVQGSVTLLAMISREGAVQDLRVLSGPPILATAAREAVRQWHFKPHYEGSAAVETLAKVTVNFTISTN